MKNKTKLGMSLIILTLSLISIVFINYSQSHISVWGSYIYKNELKDVLINTKENNYIITNPQLVLELAEEVSKMKKLHKVTPTNPPPKEAPTKYIKLMIQTKFTYGGSFWQDGENGIMMDANGYYWSVSKELLEMIDNVCNTKAGGIGISNGFDKIKSELSLIPKGYNTNNAIEDGCFVILHDKVKSKLEIMDKFVSDSQNGKSTSITIVQYLINGDTSITKLIYDGIKYYGVEYDKRNILGNPEYHQFEFNYLKVFEENDSKTYYLFNDNEITYSEFFKSMASSNSNDFIEHQFICNYKN